MEHRAQLAAATLLDDPDLTRICEQDQASNGAGPIPDFSSRRHVVEVKELTSQALRRFNAAYDALRHRHIPIESFRHLWSVSVDVSRAAGKYSGNPKTPEVRMLIATLTSMIEDLESRGLTDAFADHDNFARYARVLGFYCDCTVLPGTTLQPGILLCGSVVQRPRTLDLDLDVTALLQNWLDSDQSINARQSLAGRAGVHVLVVVPSRDGPAAAVIDTVRETPGEAPAAALRLPDNIDVLIVATDTDVLRFTPAGGWSRHPAPRSE